MRLVPSLALLLISLSALAFAQDLTRRAPNELVGGVYLSSPATLADQQATSLLFDSAGNLKVTNLVGVTTCDHSTPINFSSTSAQKIIPAAAGKKTYICAINLVVGAATNIALIEGTQAANQCDTSAAGMAGGTTAATGWNLAANGGIAQGAGIGAIMQTASASLDVCLLASAANQVSGSIRWTQL